MGLSSRQVVLALYGVCSFLGITALLMTTVNNQVLTLILIILSVITIGGMKMLGYTTDMIKINHLAKERIQQRKRFLERQRWADEIIADIRVSPDISTLKKGVIRYFENMEFDLGKFFRDGERPVLNPLSSLGINSAEGFEGNNVEGALEFTWYSPRYAEQKISPDHVWTMSIPLIINNEKYGELLVGKYLDSTKSLFESIAGLESLKQAVEQSLSQIFVP
jgi:hypothetical protein